MKYELREGEIVRVKDGKVVATVNDGKVIPTAPVYYKIIDELEAVASGQSLDSDETKSEAKGGGDTQPVDVGKTEETQGGLDSSEDGEEIENDDSAAATQEVSTEEDVSSDQERDSISTGKDRSEAGLVEPEQSKQFGDVTPGYPTWLHKTDPEKAAEQYKGRNVPEYEELISTEQS